MKKIVFVVAPKVFRDEEYAEPKSILEKANIKVTTASTVIGEIYGKIKIKAQSEILVSDISVSDYDAIFFVGGGGSSIYFNDLSVHKLVNDFYNSGKVVSAICSGSVILANSGILKGKKATVFPGDAQALISAGADYTAKDVETDGNIITGNGPAAAKKFAGELIKALN
ncbi:MAG: DJ-1/PfpI family protein [Endomicrobiaceae bacterium]|jgi:protease I|nr:DJ-1/PfpI family protein [Endomicrobiaceae bacterium]